MKRNLFKVRTMIIAGLIGCSCLFTASGMADEHRRGKGWFAHERNHNSLFRKAGDKGNETAGEIAAWLLAAANITVAMSLCIKGIQRVTPLAPAAKKSLTDFNRFQKKQLMPVHYCLNPAVMGIVLWHWLTSCCKSTALPEWGFLLMVVLMTLGILLKFKLCPKSLRKSVYQLHTQPLFFMSTIAILAIGHAIVD